jgi:hypothetical protein
MGFRGSSRTLLIGAAFFFWGYSASSEACAQTPKDTTIILISSITTQLETTQALNDMYNFKFGAAEKQFYWLRQKYGWHPLPYFLMGLSEWWKIMPDTKNLEHDERFLAYMDSTIRVAKNLFKNQKEYQVEAAFFMAAAYGFEGRLYSDEERKAWMKAASAGKDALDYLEFCKEKQYLSPELLFGDALFNYFREWVPENYPALKMMLWVFPRGNKQLGLEQLKEVSYNAFYTRTEAMVWLMRILNSYENDQPRAMQISQYLHETYPENPYFHRYYARMLYGTGRRAEMEVEARQILSRIDSGRTGYEAVSGRYASFFLGQLYEGRQEYDSARKYYQRTIEFSEKSNYTESGYYLFALISLGEIAAREGDNAEARRYFQMVKQKSGRKDEAFKAAKQRLKNMERGD